MIASPICDVVTSFVPFDKMSLVLKPSFNTSCTAFSRASASLSKSNEYLQSHRQNLK